MAGESGPRSGRNAPKKTTPKRGKAKMSAEKWAKLSKKERDIDYGGSRFSQVDNTKPREGAGSNPRDKAPTHSRSNASSRGRGTGRGSSRGGAR